MRGLMIVFLVLLALPAVDAAEMVVINSEDWHDVYTGMIYAKLAGLDAHYVVEKTQGLQLIDEVLPKYRKEVLLLESEKPIIFGYQAHLERAGFTVEKYVSHDYQKTNLDFARKLSSTDRYLVLDGNLGYSAVSVAPYALLTNAFVIFTDASNIDEVNAFLEQQGKEIILYGRVDREVKELLSPRSALSINKGDMYDDNIEIVREFIKQRPVKQVYLTNGEIIEIGLFNQEFPVLFIGTDKVPDHVLDFIKETDIRAGIVIGYDLFTNSKRIREETGIKLLLKYGQGRNSQLYALDIFPLPVYDPQIKINSIEYNSLTKQLEVTYSNTGNVYAVVQALSHLIKSDNAPIEEVGDEESFFLSENDGKTVVYNVDLTPYLDTEITVESIVSYGGSFSSLTKLLTTDNIKVKVIAVQDSSRVHIESVMYNTNSGKFEIMVMNTGAKTVYADVGIIDLLIADEKTTLSGEQQQILPGKKNVFKIKAPLQETDFENNAKVTVEVRYGEREEVLLKTLRPTFDFVLKKQDYKPLILIGIVIIILSLAVKIRRKRRGRM